MPSGEQAQHHSFNGNQQVVESLSFVFWTVLLCTVYPMPRTGILGLEALSVLIPRHRQSADVPTVFPETCSLGLHLSFTGFVQLRAFPRMPCSIKFQHTPGAPQQRQRLAHSPFFGSFKASPWTRHRPWASTRANKGTYIFCSGSAAVALVDRTFLLSCSIARGTTATSALQLAHGRAKDHGPARVPIQAFI